MPWLRNQSPLGILNKRSSATVTALLTTSLKAEESGSPRSPALSTATFGAEVPDTVEDPLANGKEREKEVEVEEIKKQVE